MESTQSGSSELVLQSNQLENIFDKIESLNFEKICENVSYKDFNFNKWINHLLKIKLEGHFPFKIGNALSHKKQRATYIGFLVGADINSRIFSIMDQNGQNLIYIPFDGIMDVFECKVRRTYDSANVNRF